RALELATASADTWTIADCHRTLATIHRKDGLPAESVARAEEAATLFLELGDKANARQSLELAAEVLSAAGDGERARVLAERARSV
ncbi:MAG: hypothetical protein JWP02_1452, partial [Acidimicrobiales bacterium]|nr:hypothetical protein [Acidimicrobiales bacterium]